MTVTLLGTPARRPHPGRDTGSLPLAMLLIIVGLGMSTLLASMVLVQLRNTRIEVQRADALHAARAGLQVAMAQLRQARDKNDAGDLSALPCDTRRPGTVGPAGGARFETTIEYFLSDPARGTAARMACPVAKTPVFARITSLGRTGSDVSRELTVTYTLRTTNEQIAGGLIYAMRLPSRPDLCLDSGPDFDTAVDISVRMQPCVPGSPRQTWAYHRNLSLVLVASQASGGLGKCVDATPTVSVRVKLASCAAKTATRQQWGYNNYAIFEGVLADGSDLNALCLARDSRTAGSYLTVAADCRSGDAERREFSPEASVGAGKAGAQTRQLVNFGQFGRCLDLTSFDVDFEYMIVWPCKQNPNLANLGWNQKWTTPAVVPGSAGNTGTISTIKPNSGAYCLRRPPTTGRRAYIRTVPCTGAPAKDIRWTIYGDTGVYATGYRVADDTKQNCMQAADQNWLPPDFRVETGTEIAKVVLMPCSDSLLQKWNAPPDITSSPLKDFREK